MRGFCGSRAESCRRGSFGGFAGGPPARPIPVPIGRSKFSIYASECFEPPAGGVSTKFFSVDDILSPYIYVFYAAFLVAFFFTPVMRAVASFYGIIDRPDRVRKMHAEPVAYLGGVAVFLGWMPGWPSVSSSTCTAATQAGRRRHPVVNFSIVLGAPVIVLLGLWDDISGVKPLTKSSAQVVAAVVPAGGRRGTECTRPTIEPLVARLYPVLFHGQASTCDAAGLVPARSSVTSSLLVVAGRRRLLQRHQPDGRPRRPVRRRHRHHRRGLPLPRRPPGDVRRRVNTNWDALRVVLGLALLGAVLGFVPYNFNPASIFMGDTGSMFLGFSLRHDDRADGPGTLQVVPGGDGHVRPADSGHAPRLRPPVGRRPAAVQRRHASTSTTNWSPAGSASSRRCSSATGWRSSSPCSARAIVFMRTRYAVAILPGHLRVDHRRGVQDGDGPRAPQWGEAVPARR